MAHSFSLAAPKRAPQISTQIINNTRHYHCCYCWSSATITHTHWKVSRWTLNLSVCHLSFSHTHRVGFPLLFDSLTQQQALSPRLLLGSMALLSASSVSQPVRSFACVLQLRFRQQRVSGGSNCRSLTGPLGQLFVPVCSGCVCVIGDITATTFLLSFYPSPLLCEVCPPRYHLIKSQSPLALSLPQVAMWFTVNWLCVCVCQRPDLMAHCWTHTHTLTPIDRCYRVLHRHLLCLLQPLCVCQCPSVFPFFFMFVCICFVCVRLSGQPVSVHQFFLLLFSESICSHCCSAVVSCDWGLSPLSLFFSLSHCLSFEWCRLGFMCVCVCCTVVAVVLPLSRVICLMSPTPKPLHLHSAIASHIKAACRTVCSVDAPSAWSALSPIAVRACSFIQFTVCLPVFSVLCLCLFLFSIFITIIIIISWRLPIALLYDRASSAVWVWVLLVQHRRLVQLFCVCWRRRRNSLHNESFIIARASFLFLPSLLLNFLRHYTTPALVGASYNAVFCFLFFWLKTAVSTVLSTHTLTNTVLDFPQSFAVKRPSVTFYYCGGGVVDSRVYLCTCLVVCVCVYIYCANVHHKK